MENKEEYRYSLRQNVLYAFLLCIVCLVINLLLAWVASFVRESTGIVLWLDTVGTIMASALGGYLPGILVGFVTNFCRGAVDITCVYYGVLNVLIAVAAAFLSDKKWLKKPVMIVPFILVMTAIGGGIGGILPWIMTGFPTQGYFTDLCWDLLDKTVSVLLVLIGLKLFPSKLSSEVKFAGWVQTPLTPDEIKRTKKIKCRSIFLRSKIMVILIVALTILAVVSTIISFVLYKNSIIDEYESRAFVTSNAAAHYIDGDKVDEFIEKGRGSEDYRKTYERLKLIYESTEDVRYVYVYKIEEEGCRVVFDISTEDLVGEEPGTLIPFDPSFDSYLPALRAGEAIPAIISNDSYGWLLTAYVPVYDDAGKCTCYVGTDIEMSILLRSEISFFTQMIFLFLGFVIIIVAVVIWFVDYSIIYPINAMTMRTSEFAYNSEDALDENVDQIGKLDIHTGDEVENLYHAFLKMTEDSVRYMHANTEKQQTITQMHRSLIMCLADMVENRDENTGQHIRKTAAYVETILKKMKEMGMHTELLSDEYINNVVMAAPLHDIGKISVPDAVLLKPGKLDDDEYEIMKTHTTCGQDVIDGVIKQIPDSGYLKEAKLLAMYHHEKWNGKGYPSGLAGEDIPLCARVMAVADVFDALVSRRCYKDAMPFDAAQGIIKKDAGSHFDPEVVEAFLAAEDEIREIERRFKEMPEEEKYNRA